MATTITITRGALRGATRSVGLAIDKRDVSRPTLTNYHVRIGNGRMLIEGSDGFRMHRWTDEIGGDASVDVMINAESLDRALKALGSANKANDRLLTTLTITDDGADLDGIPVTIYNEGGATFPDLDRLWDADAGDPDTDYVTFNPAYMVDAAKACDLAAPVTDDKAGKRTFLHTAPVRNAFRVSRTWGESGAFAALVMPVFVENVDTSRAAVIAALSADALTAETAAA